MYDVLVKKNVLKAIAKLPENNLAEDLKAKGPIQSEWPNFSKLEKDSYHCHPSGKWVAWSCRKNSFTIEVYYAGSRENAPY